VSLLSPVAAVLVWRGLRMMRFFLIFLCRGCCFLGSLLGRASRKTEFSHHKVLLRAFMLRLGVVRPE
jgi:hypothetical protein